MMSIHFNGATSQYCSSVSVASSAFAIPAGSSIFGYEAVRTGQEAPENAHIARVSTIVKKGFLVALQEERNGWHRNISIWHKTI